MDNQKIFITGNDPAQRGTVSFPISATAAQIDLWMSNYSLAGVVSGITVTQEAITPTNPQANANVDKKVKVFYYGAEKGDFSIPAPSALYIGEVGRHGRTLTNAERTTALSSWANVESKTGLFSRKSRFLQLS
jgi:hypothetical protein